MKTRARQRGWAGLVGMLIALAIVLLLGRTVLKQMGVLDPQPPVAASKRLSGQLVPDAPTAQQAVSAAQPYSGPIERARSVEGAVLDHTRDAAARVERSSQ